MTVSAGALRLQTSGDGHVVDITAGVTRIVETAGIAQGVATVFVVGSTAG